MVHVGCTGPITCNKHSGSSASHVALSTAPTVVTFQNASALSARTALKGSAIGGRKALRLAPQA